MQRRYLWLMPVMLAVLSLSCAWANWMPMNPGFESAPSESGVTQSRVRILLAAPVGTSAEALSESSAIINNRMKTMGIDADVRIIDEQIEVRLSGDRSVEDRDRILLLLTKPGLLEFVDFSGVSSPIIEGSCLQTDVQIKQYGTSDAACLLHPLTGEPFVTVMTGEIMRSASASPASSFQGDDQWQVNFALTEAGSDAFYEYTSTHIGQQLAIVVDGVLISAPTIYTGIRELGVITGQFTQAEAENLATQLRYGALPVPLSLVSIETLGITE